MSNYKYSSKHKGLDGTGAARSTLTQRVYHTVRDEIVTGVLRPGDRLVRRSLAARLGVSPMPVTEALLRLEVDGLVESEPLYGYRVRPMTVDNLKNDQIMREAIECQVARLCAENATDAELATLLVEAKKLDKIFTFDARHPTISGRMHLEFHFHLACYSGFPRLAEELARVWFRRVMRISAIKALSCRRVPKYWHQRLVETIATRDVQTAEEKMRDHVRYGDEDDQAALVKCLEQQPLEDEDND